MASSESARGARPRGAKSTIDREARGERAFTRLLASIGTAAGAWALPALAQQAEQTPSDASAAPSDASAAAGDASLFLGNDLIAWGTALGVFLVVWFVLALLRRVLRKRVDALAARRENIVALQIAASVIDQTKAWFIVLAALLVASRLLAWPPDNGAEKLITGVLTAGVLLQVGFWGTAALTTFLTRRRVRQLASDPGSVAAMDLIGFIVRVAIWSMVLLIILDNFIDVGPLIAGLGVGGIAVALAAQNILGDLFASLSIVLDKPFVVGDALAVGDFSGTVEKIGLKTTRMRSVDGEQVVMANSDLLGSRIRNYGRMADRRVVFTLGVTYRTTPQQLKAIPEMVKQIIEAEKDARFDRAHFQKFGDSALLFEIVYFVKSSNYGIHVGIQQRVNIAIYERFAQDGIEFAYPTQTLYIVKEDGDRADDGRTDARRIAGNPPRSSPTDLNTARP